MLVPVGATINPISGEFSWTPPVGTSPGNHTVTVRVTDDGESNLDDFETINITVREVNQAPVLAAIGNKSVDEGSPLTFTAAATDPNLPANNLSFSLDFLRGGGDDQIRVLASSVGHLPAERRRVTTQ